MTVNLRRPARVDDEILLSCEMGVYIQSFLVKFYFEKKGFIFAIQQSFIIDQSTRDLRMFILYTTITRGTRATSYCTSISNVKPYLVFSFFFIYIFTFLQNTYTFLQKFLDIDYVNFDAHVDSKLK